VRRSLYQAVRIVSRLNRIIPKSIGLALAIAVLFLSIASAQSNLSLDGQIYDKNDGSAISNATIEIIDLGTKTKSNNLGSFAFKNVPTGLYSIKITAVGYDDTTLNHLDIKPDITQRVTIKMSERVYELGKIVVRSKKPEICGNRVIVISRTEIQQSHSRDLSKILETIEGVLIQKAGPSGESHIRIRGCDPGHVLVLIDGQKINPSGSGIADLSGIPVDIIERIELYKGGSSAEFGPDALAGAINIITRPVRLFEKAAVDARQGWGIWDTKITELNLSNPVYFKNFSNRWSFLSRQSDGDFSYAYSVTGSNGTDSTHTGIRLNNSFESNNFFVSGIYQLSGKISLSYSGQNYNSKRGLPDRATRQNETAKMSDRRKLFTGAFNYKVADVRKLELEFGYSQYDQHFHDIDTLGTLRYDSEFINDIYTLRHNQNYSFFNGNMSRYTIMYRHEVLNHTDRLRPLLSMGRTSRNNFSTQAAVSQKADLSEFILFDIMSLNAAVRFDISRTEKDSTSYADTVKTNSTKQISPNFGLALSKGENISYIIRASYGKSFRLPTLNALFWKGDVRSSGNPGLKPEKSEHSEAGVELKLDFGDIMISAGLTYFHSFVKDLVVWAPNAQGVWRPKNLALSQTTGHEDFVHIDLFRNKIRISYENTISTSLNKTAGHNSYGKRLSFSPHYITTISARLNLSPLFCSYSVRLVGRAYINEANTRYYDAYRLDDARLGLSYNLSDNWQISIRAEIENIFDTNYVLMTHYPMPGRSWSLFIGLNYQKGKENK